ncbi:MAG: 3'-5' exonuclease [Lamprobacter sp.]|uniref:3'-5' exonuclease n=1 Tax=Lamprobacter sp. TaxID=3100796 RepID=UPI002B259C90|nr:3'-5' exonuclease [Lamprobacter sp.]MEA3642549.1 3'-5' exonuclease [Lamprobacter sp.]
MLRKAPSNDRVMGEVSDFVGDYRLVAHNASFDRTFWDAELDRIRVKRKQDFVCSMLLSRRLLPQAPNHQLGTLMALAGLPVTGRYHRALADAEMTANLTIYLEQELMLRFSLGFFLKRIWPIFASCGPGSIKIGRTSVTTRRHFDRR